MTFSVASNLKPQVSDIIRAVKQKGSKSKEFFPEHMSRQGEIIAWGLAFAILVLMWFLTAQTGGVSIWIVILFGFFLLSSLAISFSNWMDSRTVLQIKSDGVSFKNGLRNVNFKWDEIESIRVIPAPRSTKRIQVSGRQDHFEIRTMTRFEYKGKQQGTAGFAQGEEILQTLLRETGLRKDEVEENYYYVKK